LKDLMFCITCLLVSRTDSLKNQSKVLINAEELVEVLVSSQVLALLNLLTLVHPSPLLKETTLLWYYRQVDTYLNYLPGPVKVKICLILSNILTS